MHGSYQSITFPPVSPIYKGNRSRTTGSGLSSDDHRMYQSKDARSGKGRSFVRNSTVSGHPPSGQAHATNPSNLGY